MARPTSVEEKAFFAQYALDPQEYEARKRTTLSEIVDKSKTLSLIGIGYGPIDEALVDLEDSANVEFASLDKTGARVLMLSAAAWLFLELNDRLSDEHIDPVEAVSKEVDNGKQWDAARSAETDLWGGAQIPDALKGLVVWRAWAERILSDQDNLTADDLVDATAVLTTGLMYNYPPDHAE